MKPMAKKSDVLDVIMAAPMDDEEAEGEGQDSGDPEVMSFDHGDDEEAEGVDDGSPQATIDGIRKSLDELEKRLS